MIPPSDLALMKRLTIALVALFVLTAAFAQLYSVYSQKFYKVTGEAKWIWARHRMSDDLPLAFFAARDIDLPEHRRYAHLKVLGDPEYTLFVNGREVAGRRIPPEDRQIDFYDISQLVRTGRNRIVVAVRARQGVGGLIAALDIGPETENWIVTDDRWRIFRRWNAEILRRDPPDLAWESPVVIGEPPVGRWNFLPLARREFAPAPTTVIAAKDSFPMKALLPRIRMRSGIAVAVAEQQRARAFDFGPTSGRIRIMVDRDPPFGSRAILMRTANHHDELGAIDWNARAVVFAPGERAVVTPDSHDFRYVLVYGVGASADVLR